MLYVKELKKKKKLKQEGVWLLGIRKTSKHVSLDKDQNIDKHGYIGNWIL